MTSDMRLADLLAALAFAVLTVAGSSGAEAHHVVSQYGIAPAEPVTRASLKLQMRRFDFDGGPAGSARVATPRIQYAPVSWLSGVARLPVASLQYDDATNRFGIGDLAVGAQVRAFATDHGGLIVSAGLGSELPTGDVAAGFGAGHVELAPFVVVSSSPTDNLVVFGSVTEQFAVGGGGGHGGHGDGGHGHDHAHGGGSIGSSVHGAVIAPHAAHEMRTRVGVAYVLDPVYLSVVNSVVFAWSRDRTLGPYDAGLELGWRALEDLRLALGADVPVLGPDRFEWTTQLAASWTF
jgi:hypothetical protein